MNPTNLSEIKGIRTKNNYQCIIYILFNNLIFKADSYLLKMNHQELFNLRRNKTLQFPSSDGLLEFLEGLMVEEVKLPLVVGNEKIPETEWQVILLSPDSIASELRVRNYFEGLRKVNSIVPAKRMLVKEDSNPEFSASVSYEGIKALDMQHKKVFGIQISVRNPLATPGSYSLSRSFNLDFHNQGDRYISATEIHKPRLERIMEHYMGPRIVQ